MESEPRGANSASEIGIWATAKHPPFLHRSQEFLYSNIMQVRFPSLALNPCILLVHLSSANLSLYHKCAKVSKTCKLQLALPQTVSPCFIGTHDLYQPFQTKATLNCLPTAFQRSPEIRTWNCPLGLASSELCLTSWIKPRELGMQKKAADGEIQRRQSMR
jgi:hypothetical protein